MVTEDKTRSSVYRLLLLLSLYMSQGLPFGFQATALPVWLRQNGESLAAIGFAGALSIPWMIKFLWAPFIDRFGNGPLGRRRTWIIPLQLLLVAVMALTATVDVRSNLFLLLSLVFIMNLIASVQDIAVDGLAVDILSTVELGPGNAAQVAGYKAGMILSGGLLLWLSSRLGWNSYFIIMAFLAAIPLFMILPLKEFTGMNNADAPHITIGEIIRYITTWISEPGGLSCVAFIATYKAGECLIDMMFKPFLVDSGISASTIGLWVGTWGMGASIAGSIAGGVFARYLPLPKALAITLAIRLLPLIAQTALTTGIPGEWALAGVTVMEHLCGGMVTTCVFAYMMSRVDHRMAATHYTVLASIEVFGKSPGVWLSGILAQRLGYTSLFTIGTILSALVLLFIPLLKRGSSNR